MKIDRKTKKGRIYTCFLYIALGCTVITCGFVWTFTMWKKVPSSIHVRAGKEQGMEFYVPATATIYKNKEQEKVSVNLHKKLTFYGEAEDTYTMKVQLFGFIPFKKTQVSVIQDTLLTPAGFPIGIYIQTDGILVIDTGNFTSIDGKKVAPAKKVLQSGDYILKMDGKPLENKEQLVEQIGESKGRELLLEVKRGTEIMQVPVRAIQDKTGEYKLGIWVRDNAQGIGTMTFVDELGHFGALGHGINDQDTASLMEVREGGLYKTDIIAITPGKNGNPGELTGVIAYASQNKMGDIIENTRRGIYGVIRQEAVNLIEQPIPIALKQEVKEGSAQILCTLSTTPAYYDVEITAIHLEQDHINRGLEITVTDEELLSTTGGIIQGMSGSPIIQDGKIVGAITHVMVNDPAKGYGIFIESMLGN